MNKKSILMISIASVLAIILIVLGVNVIKTSTAKKQAYELYNETMVKYDINEYEMLSTNEISAPSFKELSDAEKMKLTKELYFIESDEVKVYVSKSLYYKYVPYNAMFPDRAFGLYRDNGKKYDLVYPDKF